MRRKGWEVPESLVEVVALLKGLEIFEGASDPSLKALASAATERTFPSGTDVIREGRIPTDFYVVRSGTLEVWSSGEAGESQRHINTLTDGDHFGEVGLIEGMPSTATVRTATTCELISVGAADFLQVVSDTPSLAQPLLRRITGALARSHPSYRSVAESETDRQTPEELVAEIRGRLEGMSDDERARLVEGLKELLEGL